MTFSPNRIMVIGASGAGKSTLALKLGQSLELPIVHMDRFFFHPGWVQRDPAETDSLACEAADGAAWVFEGNNSRTMDYRAERADLIVVMELSRVRRLTRCLWRVARQYGRVRPDMAEGCSERFDAAFLFSWVWGWDKINNGKQAAFLARWQDRRPILRIGSARAADQLAADPASVFAAIERRGLTG